eukprot:Pompholyxophrys_sp_v1_NODE_105_length_1967_cov_3.812762.p3 type:complete len:110 gc:universal NODE_105_length_1967_cov_3.812762:1095-766(-)
MLYFGGYEILCQFLGTGLPSTNGCRAFPVDVGDGSLRYSEIFGRINGMKSYTFTGLLPEYSFMNVRKFRHFELAQSKIKIILLAQLLAREYLFQARTIYDLLSTDRLRN